MFRVSFNFVGVHFRIFLVLFSFRNILRPLQQQSPFHYSHHCFNVVNLYVMLRPHFFPADLAFRLDLSSALGAGALALFNVHDRRPFPSHFAFNLLCRRSFFALIHSVSVRNAPSVCILLRYFVVPFALVRVSCLAFIFGFSPFCFRSGVSHISSESSLFQRCTCMREIIVFPSFSLPTPIPVPVPILIDPLFPLQVQEAALLASPHSWRNTPSLKIVPSSERTYLLPLHRALR